MSQTNKLKHDNYAAAEATQSALVDHTAMRSRRPAASQLHLLEQARVFGWFDRKLHWIVGCLPYIIRWLTPTTYHGWKRVVYFTLLVVLLGGVITPVTQNILLNQRYVLAASENSIVGTSNANLMSKLSFDSQHQIYIFNQNGIKQDSAGGNPTAQLRQQVGNGGKHSSSLYSVIVPVNLSEGLTYYDNNLNVSFKLIPQFKTLPGQKEQGRLVYPLMSGGKLVYSFKGNGLKEDILLDKAPDSGALSLSYKLDLPDSLQARAIASTGSIGVYSADPALYGNITYSSDKDQTLVAKARAKSQKNNLVFVLPSPVINEPQQRRDTLDGRFVLSGDILSVAANNLDGLSYPLSIDPSVVITSTADFSMGNNEGNISYPANQINRANVTGGSAGSWGSTNSMPNGRVDAPAVAYNGWLYVMGGYGWYNSGANCCQYESDVAYAQLSSSGTVGSWTTSTTSLPYGLGVVGNGTGRADLSTVAYNGYLYITAGWNGTTYYNDVWYVKINSNGSIGNSFTQTTSYSTGRIFAAFVAYGNHIYILGGQNSSSVNLQDVQYANINGDGTLGSWSSASNLYLTARFDFPAVAYNGRIYIFGGYTTTYANDVQYAVIKSSGDLGTWYTTTPFNTARQSQCAVVYDGYIYITGGKDASFLSDTQYAPIYANGTIGAWTTNHNTFTNNRADFGSIAYGGYLYITMGYSTSASNYMGDVQSSPIDPAGIVDNTGSGAASTYTTSGNAFTTGRFGVEEVAYNGYLYVLGGTNGTGPVATIYYAAINSDGTIGAFSLNTNNFTNSRDFFAAVAYNGNMYVIGGCSSKFSLCTTSGNNLGSVVQATISSSTGAVGAFNLVTDTALGTSVFGLGAVAYNGYMYVFGGNHLGTFESTIFYQAFGANGTLSGTWSASGKSLATATTYMGVTAYGGYVYITGGCTVGALTCTTRANTDLYYATIGNGDIGTLNVDSTNTFSTARGMMGLTAANGYLYLSGGWNGTTYYADTQFAPIGTSGDITAGWTTAISTTLSSTRAGIGSAAYNGFVYVAGGYNGTTYYTDAQYAQVNNGGSGVTGSWTTTGTNFSSSARDNNVAVAYNGYLYVLGGTNGSNYGDVFYVSLNSDGSIGTWGSTSSLPTNRYGFGAVAYNGYMYIMGGFDSTYESNVYHATINTSNGTLSSWSSGGTDASFANARYEFGAAAYNGYLYIAGGVDGSTNYHDVEYAPVSSTTGVVSSWTDDTTNTFTSIRSNLGMTIYNGYMYIAGGQNGTTYYNDVQYSLINTGTGDVGAFSTTTPFNINRYGLKIEAYNGFLYMLGGYDGTTYYTDVQIAPINPNGTIGNWNTVSGSTAMTARELFGAAIYNGYMYIAGGLNSGGALNTTQYAPLSTIARVGEYSTLIDFGTVGQVMSVPYDDNTPVGLISFSFQIAWPNGIFGSIFTTSNLVTTVSNTYAGRYLWVAITLDDTQYATFPDNNTSAVDTNVTDFTINYNTGPTPGTRLRHGASFINGALQPLDTFGP